MKIFLQDCPVVEVKGQVITIALGNSVYLHIHTLGQHTIKVGEKLPLLTEIPYAKFGPANSESGS